jgi:NADPH:quinone reductase-like Zn-dependent oxidoreductase
LGNYVVLPEEFVRKMPVSLDFEEAATLPYTLMCVWDILVTQGGLKPIKNANASGASGGNQVLICGGLRPQELLSLQLAKL